MNFWHHFLSVYFGFNRQQRNGLFVLLVLIVVLFAVRLSLSHFIRPDPMVIADFSHLKFTEPVAEPGNAAETKSREAKPGGEGLFVFDPNTVTKEQLVKLGFREKAAGTFINYRNKGGRFRKKEDLKKVYGVSNWLYERLEPFILIETAPEKQAGEATAKNDPTYEKAKPAEKPARQKIELNGADSLTLLTLKGIGPAFTKRILKYRSLLGGFISVDQLAEVYGMEDELFQSLKQEVTVDASLIKKLNINSENFKELNRHPYMSYELTKAVFNFRRKNGAIKSMDQLKQAITDEAALGKLAPYLVFE